MADVINSIGAQYKQSPLIVKTKSQGLRPQTAVQRYKLQSGKRPTTSGKAPRPMTGVRRDIAVKGL